MNKTPGEIVDCGRLWERPLGIPFADDLVFTRIPDWKARRIYRDHHSYRPDLDRVTITNHAVLLDGHLVGAVTYAMPRRDSPLLGVGVEGMIEVARVCVAAAIPNLASCMLARSQDRFMSRWGKRNAVDLFISMVHADYNGSMFAALRGKGWRNLRTARSRRSGNRDYTGIEDEEKELWACPVERERSEQTTLAVSTGTVDDDAPTLDTGVAAAGGSDDDGPHDEAVAASE